MQKLLKVILMVSLMACGKAQAAYAYYGLEPDIVTNYIGTSSQKLGYVRLTIELMLEDASLIPLAEHHEPLLRSTIIDILGRQPEEKVKSLTGREEIRQVCLQKLREFMKKETGKDVVKDVIFTKYLYQG
ncbi:flagellar basal body-associated protein FliL [Aliiglaciecola sp. CAU 1673]|uniref:flagellar basal body-associated protein FliL n=1 Tax=Aliiglaciecola sp. CAU 1673 TaxID=3032595 RepID=UPI0023D997F5|nr:flagellar basal body-associated protein FliL [Aliiglaciecola sp. CAU 1673]MDF2179264.1 flagellar basal body-associated protein FliL [Aliiglaciecola sp. CAU 1673]